MLRALSFGLIVAATSSQVSAAVPFDPEQVNCAILQIAMEFPDTLSPEAMTFLEGIAQGVLANAATDDYPIEMAHFMCLGDRELSLAEAFRQAAIQAADDGAPATDEEQLADAVAHLAELDQRREMVLRIIGSLESIIELKAAEQ